jgi:phosphate transport system permease protein
MALGATKWQTIWKQLLPAALPGIATGAILSLSRAIGETAPLIVVGAAYFATSIPSGFGADVTALPIQIFSWVSDPRPEYKALAAAGIIVLMAILLAMNAVAIWLRNRYEQKW